LFGNNSEVITIEGLRLVTRVGVARGFREVNELAKWTRSLILSNLPIQPILFAFIADKLLRVLFYFVVVVSLSEILLLRIGYGAAHLDSGQLAVAYTASKDIVLRTTPRCPRCV
jgi:hypothetical protein